nr:AsmA family protein [Rhodoferax sp.]
MTPVQRPEENHRSNVRKRAEWIALRVDNFPNLTKDLSLPGRFNRTDTHTTMTASCLLKWTAGLLLAPVLLAALFIAIFGWNWMRGPIERMTLDKTGRELVINGDLQVKLGWPSPHLVAGVVTFANPAWAKEKQMLAAAAADISIDLSQLLRRQIVL